MGLINNNIAKLTMLVMVMAVVLATAIRTTEAQTATCASKLVPCAAYLNATTKPPDSCCNPIKEAVENERDCLCNLYNTPGFLASFNVSVSDALRLTRNCGINDDLSACNGTAQSPASVPPPGVPGNDGGRIASTGIASLLLFWASIMLY